MVNAAPSTSGIVKSLGRLPSGKPRTTQERKKSRSGWVSASAEAITILGRPRSPTRDPGESTDPSTQSSFATKNVFDVLQDLSDSIGGFRGLMLEAADGLSAGITHDLHQSLIEPFKWAGILSMHAVRRVGRERHLHLKIRALCGEPERVFNVLADTGAPISLVRAGLIPPECLTTSQRSVRLNLSNDQYMVGGMKEAEISLQFVNHRELGGPELGKEILLKGKLYEAQMDWDMINGRDFMMERDFCVVPAQACITLYQDEQLLWLSLPEHHVECQSIRPECHHLGVAALGGEPARPTYHGYGF